MKKSDWVFLAVAAAVAVAIWYFFIRKGAPMPIMKTSTKAELTQNHMVGSGMVIPDASDFAAGHYGVDYSQIYP
jgi:hypothetical protein